MTRISHSLGETVIGGEIATEQIRSSNLGDHDRNRGGILLEHRMKLVGGLHLELGDYTYYHEQYGWESWPGASLIYRIKSHSSVYLNYGQAYRIPTFSDLYYRSPANVGNPDLQPERSRTYEAGYKWLNSWLYGSTAVFYRDSYNLIDWTRSAPDDPWQVQNIRNAAAYGAEFNAKIYPNVELVGAVSLNLISIQYAYLDMKTGTIPAESKYVLNYIQHHLQAGLTLQLPLNLRQQWLVRYIDRNQAPAYTVADLNTICQLGQYRFSLEVTNLFDTNYEELPGIPMPGREYRVGVSVRLR